MALSANVTAAQVCGYDVQFGGVGATTTVVRTRLSALTLVNVAVRDFCPIKYLENSPQVVTNPITTGVSQNCFAPFRVQIVDAAGIDAADSIAWRVSGRLYQGVP
jgi:hypothetical protein